MNSEVLCTPATGSDEKNHLEERGVGKKKSAFSSTPTRNQSVSSTMQSPLVGVVNEGRPEVEGQVLQQCSGWSWQIQ